MSLPHAPSPGSRKKPLALLLAFCLLPLVARAEDWSGTLHQAEQLWELGDRPQALSSMRQALELAKEAASFPGIGHCSLQMGILLLQEGEKEKSCAALHQSRWAFSRALDRDRIQESWTGSPPSWLRAAVTATPQDWSAFESSLLRTADCDQTQGKTEEAAESRILAKKLRDFRLGESPEVRPSTSWLTSSAEETLGTRRLPDGVLRTLDLPGPISCLAFSPDSQMLAVGVGGTSSSIQIHEVATGSVLGSFSLPGDGVHALLFTPEGKQLLLARSDRLEVLAVPSFQPPAKILPDNPLRTPRTVSDLAYLGSSPETRRLVASTFTPVGADPELLVWQDLSHPPETHTVQAFETLASLAVSLDGAQLALAGTDSAVLVLDEDLEILNLLDPYQEGQRDLSVADLAFGPEGQLAVAYRDGSFRIWDTSNQERPVRTFQGDATSPPQDMRFGQGGTRLYSGHLDGRLGIWDPETGTSEGFVSAHGSYLWSVKLSPDGSILATGDGAGMVLLWANGPRP